MLSMPEESGLGSKEGGRSYSSPPRLPSPPSSMDSSTLTPDLPPPPLPKGDALEDDVMADAPDCKAEEFLNIFPDADTAERVAKYDRYEAGYVRRIKAKYFSNKTPNGGNIFDEETKLEDEIIKSSRWPCTKPFIDVIQISEYQGRSSPAAETSATVSSRKSSTKKQLVT